VIFGFEVVSAKPKKAAPDDAPNQQSMRPSGIRSAPSTDQKRARRLKAKSVTRRTAASDIPLGLIEIVGRRWFNVGYQAAPADGGIAFTNEDGAEGHLYADGTGWVLDCGHGATVRIYQQGDRFAIDRGYSNGKVEIIGPTAHRTARLVKSECSGCFEPFTLNTVAMTVKMIRPSNGIQGRRHVPAGPVKADVSEYKGLLEWDCPLCGYAESEEDIDPYTSSLTPTKDSARTARRITAAFADGDQVYVQGDPEPVTYVGSDWLGQQAPTGMVWIEVDGDVAPIDASRITSTKESSMTTNAREVELLQAMAKATPRELTRLAADLEVLRATAVADRDGADGIDLANTVVAAHLTPVPTMVRHTASTDWMGEIASPTADPTLGMKTAATMWFAKVSPEVRADHDEFTIQARGTAIRLASAHGDRAEMATRAFLDHVSHLRALAGDQVSPVVGPDAKAQTGNGESTVTDYDTKADQAPFLAEDWEDTGDTGWHPPLPGVNSTRVLAGQSWFVYDKDGKVVDGPFPSADEAVTQTDEAAGEAIDTADSATKIGSRRTAAVAHELVLMTDGDVLDFGEASVQCAEDFSDGIRQGAFKTSLDGQSFEFAYGEGTNDSKQTAAVKTQRFLGIPGTLGSRRTAGPTCGDCGAAIERDPAGEKNRSWHHNDSRKHDHEAVPRGDSKESAKGDGQVPPEFKAQQEPDGDKAKDDETPDWLEKKIKGSKTARFDDIIGWTADAAIYCPEDAEHIYGVTRDHDAVDSEGNDVHPIFATDEIEPGEVCTICGEPIGSTRYAARRTSADTIDSSQQNGNAWSDLDQVEVTDEGAVQPAFPWVIAPGTGTDAADVSGTPTPGGTAGYPQPKGASRKTASLNDQMEMDHVVQVHADGTVTDGPSGVYAPEIYLEVDADGSYVANTEADAQRQAKSQGWTLMSGYSGQQGNKSDYVLMHASEYIGGGMERDILAAPGLYVALVPSLDDDSEPENWVVAYRKSTTSSLNPVTAASQSVWQSDFDKVTKALKPYVEVFEDGFQGVSPDAPADLTRIYEGLLQLGYANGYLASKSTTASLNPVTAAFRARVAANLRRQASDGPWFVTHDSPVYGGENMAGPFATRSEAEAALAAWSGPKNGSWSVSDIDYSTVDHGDFGPADGDWSSWLVQNNID